MTILTVGWKVSWKYRWHQCNSESSLYFRNPTKLNIIIVNVLTCSREHLSLPMWVNSHSRLCASKVLLLLCWTPWGPIILLKQCCVKYFQGQILQMVFITRIVACWPADIRILKMLGETVYSKSYSFKLSPCWTLYFFHPVRFLGRLMVLLLETIIPKPVSFASDARLSVGFIFYKFNFV